MAATNKKCCRFYPAMDNLLLRQILADWPNIKWETIEKKLNEAMVTVRPDSLVTARGCKDRYKKLMAAYRSEELASLRA